jgi:hypothetical protein
MDKYTEMILSYELPGHNLPITKEGMFFYLWSAIDETKTIDSKKSCEDVKDKKILS